MAIELILTGDGSHTLRDSLFYEIYHSRHGAIDESIHVYIQNGLAACSLREICVFEVGFGTGLNALLSWKYADENNRKIRYTGLELYPVPADIAAQINYGTLLPDYDQKFKRLHLSDWGHEVVLSENFALRKVKDSLTDIAPPQDSWNVVFFDAFAPTTQPELWTVSILKKVYDMMAPGGLLTTYCSKSVVRKDMVSVGFRVEKLHGPHGKRDMVRAWKD